MSTRVRIALSALAIIAVSLALFFKFSPNYSSGEDIVNGGEPCIYDTTIIAARVLEVNLYSAEYGDVLLEIKGRTDYADTVHYSDLSPYRALKRETIEKAGIQKDELLKCTCFKIKTGSCSPYIYTPTLEKY